MIGLGVVKGGTEEFSENSISFWSNPTFTYFFFCVWIFWGFMKEIKANKDKYFEI
jgi:hypothetical protein